MWPEDLDESLLRVEEDSFRLIQQGRSDFTLHVLTSLSPSGSFGNDLDLQRVSRNQNLTKKHSPPSFPCATCLNLTAGCHEVRFESVTHSRHTHCARYNGAYDMQVVCVCVLGG